MKLNGLPYDLLWEILEHFFLFNLLILSWFYHGRGKMSNSSNKNDCLLAFLFFLESQKKYEGQKLIKIYIL